MYLTDQDSETRQGNNGVLKVREINKARTQTPIFQLQESGLPTLHRHCLYDIFFIPW